MTPNGGSVTTMLAVSEETEGDARGRKSGAAIETSRGGGSNRFTLPMRTIFLPVLGCDCCYWPGCGGAGNPRTSREVCSSRSA